VIKDFDTRQQAENLVSYIKTRFFRFMMSLIKNTQNISKASYAFVPIQDFSESWTDEKLYKKYGLTEEEIAFIESLIRPME
jgi:site-specific DNA-methyltransferase (adenine-specific)